MARVGPQGHKKNMTYISQLQFCSKSVIYIYIYIYVFEQNCNCDNLKVAALGRNM